MLENLKVLLIENDHDDKELIKLILAKGISGLYFKSTNSFEKFKQEIRSKSYDVILTDLHLDGFDGFDVVEYLRDREIEVPVILITGERAYETALQAIQLQVDDYVIKTLDYIKKLPEIIDRVISSTQIEYAKRTSDESLSNSIHSYKEIFETSQELIQSTWPDGSFLNANRIWCETLEYKLTEINGLNINDIVAPESRLELDEIIKLSTSGINYLKVALVMKSKSSKKIFTEGSVSSRYSASKPIALDWILKDVSQSKELENSILDTNSQYISAFEFAPVPMVLGDHRGKVMQINQAACDLVGFSYDEMIGRHFKDITHPEDWKKSEKFLKKIMLGEIDKYTMEKRYQHKSGKYVAVEVNASLVRNDNGKPRFAIAQFKKIE